ncbi:tetratricopeptide repeat-containing response regulator [Zooshikella ganghwensis]|uniref:Response regulator n=1 Tax=Zooshikella ganghwensis TaxID=202772 RepID=A0A4P9VJS2_9GAMM|nr:tetratricopeptide repeat-containing response regulator [Zooshikella ganghwensis]RDH42042.1 response regulator [Zooshikella ganghwensis]
MAFINYKDKSFLIIDDFENFRLSIKKMLDSFGVSKVDMAINGRDAVLACKNQDYDVILCDYNLGSGKNGQQVLDELRYTRRLKNTSLFLLITAEATKDMVLGALEHQPDAYLTKPITQSMLKNRLDRLMDEHYHVLPIKKAIDQNNIKQAIKECQKVLSKDSRSHKWCTRKLAELYYQNKDYDEAEQICQKQLEERKLDWPYLTLGKVAAARKNYPQALEYFNQLLAINPQYVNCYDEIAATYLAVGEPSKAQQAIMTGVQISPRSVHRQLKLAEISRQNDDLDTATQAYRNTVELGKNSIHDAVDNHLNFARCLSDNAEHDNSKEGKLQAKEALNILEQISKKYKDDPKLMIQSAMITSRVHAGQNNKDDAEKALNSALKAMENMGDGANPNTQLEMAKTLFANNRTEDAENILRQVIAENPDKQDLIDQANALLDEPVSIKNRIKAAAINLEAITAYEQQNFTTAIEKFTEALKFSSRHPGLNLNLIQAYLKQMSDSGLDKKTLDKCQTYLNNVNHIHASHPQFERYEALKSKIASLRKKLSA